MTCVYRNDIIAFLEGTDDPFRDEPRRTIIRYKMKKDGKGNKTKEPEDP